MAPSGGTLGAMRRGTTITLALLLVAIFAAAILQFLVLGRA
jgi:hypothetical protein